jgi:uncharacterized protein (TIGR02996 family)
MTENQRLLLKEIIKNPAEDSVRLEYADCIQEELGEEERAEFIRVQCAIAAFDQTVSFDPVDNRIWVNKLNELRRRERELLEKHKGEWFPTTYYQRFSSKYTRGFISHITCTAEDFLKHADSLVWNEKMTDECPECKGHGEVSDPWFAGDDSSAKCYACKKGRIPRPMPDTAMPIESVVLYGFDHRLVNINEFALHTQGDELRANNIIWRSYRWPGIEFELPHNTGNQEVPVAGYIDRTGTLIFTDSTYQ